MKPPIEAQRCRPTDARRRVGHRLLALLLLCAGAAQAQAEPSAELVGCQSGPAVAAISEQRERFNAAIRNKDIDTIDEVLADDVILVTGTDSDVYTGRVRQLALWAQDFHSDARWIYVRTPNCIERSDHFPIAMEQGHWRGEPEVPDGTFFAGRYSAKWRNDGTRWRLEVETYMTDTCKGADCPDDKEP